MQRLHKGITVGLHYISIMIATLLRSTLLCVSSLIPENSPLDSVVFRSSVQILLSVFYFALFTTVSIMIRVLMSRRALDNPTDVGHADVGHDPERAEGDRKTNRHDEVVFDDSDDDSVSISYAPQLTKANASRRKRMRDSGITVLTRVGRKVRQMASVLVVGPEGAHKGGASYVRHHVPSVDDPLSGMSDSASGDELDSGAGVQFARALRVAAKKQNVGDEKQNVDDDRATDKVVSVAPQEGVDDTPSGSYSLTYVQAAAMDDIYTDVYGIGFAAYVLHYTIDCASIQPTAALLIGLTLLSARDVALISDAAHMDDSVPQTTLFTRALTIFSFMLLLVAQVCMIMGIVRVPTYYTDARDGGITMIPAPQSILENLLAWVFPLIAPLFLFFVSRKRSQRRQPVPSVSTVFRRAMPITVCIALWFITCFGAMSDRVRNAVGALSVNATVAELSMTDVTIDMHLSLMVFSPFVKTPALMSVISCCLSRKTMDITTALAVVFYAKQLHAVRDAKMLEMINVALICSCIAWFSCIIRYCSPLVRAVASCFDNRKEVVIIEDKE
jgi:hypothetical protein